VVCSGTDNIKKTKVAIKKVQNAFEDLVDAKRILREIKMLSKVGESWFISRVLPTREYCIAVGPHEAGDKDGVQRYIYHHRVDGN
jgi:hypothetical protein